MVTVLYNPTPYQREKYVEVDKEQVFGDQFSRMKVEVLEGSKYVKVNMGPFEVKALTLVD